MIKFVVISMSLLVLFTTSFASDSDYEKKFADQMGTKAPDVKNMTQAGSTADNGAVYANRNAAEFAIVAWNFEPSKEPLKLKESIKPLSNESLEHLKTTNCDGFIVVKNGKIIHEYYANGMHQTTKHNAYSAGKSWTSAVWHETVLGMMNKKVKDVIPELKESIYGSQTVRQVVDMRSPVFWYEDYNDPKSPVVISGGAAGWDFVSTDLDQIEFLKSLKKNPKLSDGDWYYVSSNTMVMGLLGSMSQKIHAYEGLRRFYEKLGLEHISGTIANLHGQYSAEGGQYFTLRDFVKLPYALANAGIVNGKRVIQVDYINDLFDADKEKMNAWKNGPYGPQLKEISYYSNQWYIVNENIAIGIGSYGQYIIFNKEANLAMAKFSTYPKGQDYDMAPKDVSWLIKQVQSGE